MNGINKLNMSATPMSKLTCIYVLFQFGVSNAIVFKPCKTLYYPNTIFQCLNNIEDLHASFKGLDDSGDELFTVLKKMFKTMKDNTKINFNNEYNKISELLGFVNSDNKFPTDAVEFYTKLITEFTKRCKHTDNATPLLMAYELNRVNDCTYDPILVLHGGLPIANETEFSSKMYEDWLCPKYLVVQASPEQYNTVPFIFNENSEVVFGGYVYDFNSCVVCGDLNRPKSYSSVIKTQDSKIYVIFDNSEPIALESKCKNVLLVFYVRRD